MDVTQRFMEKVSVAESGCWNWLSTLDRGGYGKFWFLGAQSKAHRVSYELLVGSSEGKWVLHKCDNRKCVNPSHLYLGNALRNARDRTARRRWGVRKPFQVVSEIRAKYAAGCYTQAQLAGEYRVHQTQISKYIRATQRFSH